MASQYRNTLETYLGTLAVKADRVLDVAGASNPVRDRVKSWDVGRYDVLDNELELPSIAIKYRADMNEGLGYSYDPAEWMGRYDLVFCLELMEYIWNPVQCVTNLRQLMADTGRLVITFPFVYPNHNPVAFDMLRYTKQGAEKILRHAGFVIDRVIPRLMNHTGQWQTFLDLDGYRYKGAQEAGTMFDAGYIIEAHRKP